MDKICRTICITLSGMHGALGMFKQCSGDSLEAVLCWSVAATLGIWAVYMSDSGEKK